VLRKAIWVVSHRFWQIRCQRSVSDLVRQIRRAVEANERYRRSRHLRRRLVFRHGQDLIAIVIDCKEYKNPVDIKDVEAFIAMIEELFSFFPLRSPSSSSSFSLSLRHPHPRRNRLYHLWAVWLRQRWPSFMYVHILGERNNFVGLLRLALEGDPYI